MYKANNQEGKKITLPKELQRQMMKFFLETSILRKKSEKINLPSEKERDGSAGE